MHLKLSVPISQPGRQLVLDRNETMLSTFTAFYKLEWSYVIPRI